MPEYNARTQGIIDQAGTSGKDVEALSDPGRRALAEANAAGKLPGIAPAQGKTPLQVHMDQLDAMDKRIKDMERMAQEADATKNSTAAQTYRRVAAILTARFRTMKPPAAESQPAAGAPQ